MKAYTFTKGYYTIEIYADTKDEAQKQWDMLQARNYYPTGRKWYSITQSIDPPKK